MPKFAITAFEKWEHKVFYDIVANSVADAIERIRTGEAVPSDHRIGEVLGDSLVCVETIIQNGRRVEVPAALREEQPDPQALTPRELAMVVQSLRMMQDELNEHPDLAEELALLPRFEGHVPLTVEEIDALCERLIVISKPTSDDEAVDTEWGRCDTCGAPCNEDGCLFAQWHPIAK
jgi:hypothetical protein